MSVAYEHLPGGDLVAAGIDDLTHGRASTPDALLVAAAATRLRAAGVPVPEGVVGTDAPHALYRALGEEHGTDAHGRYLALVRQLESFARAVEHASRG